MPNNTKSADSGNKSPFKRIPRFEQLHRSLSSKERDQLKRAISQDGQRDPVVLMQGDILIDGHHRDEICRELGIETKFVIKIFAGGEDEAYQWALRLQLARRNLSAPDYHLTIGRLYNSIKGERGGDQKSKVQNEPLINAQESVSQSAGISTTTVKRHGKYAEVFDKLPGGIQDLIIETPKLASRNAVIMMAAMKPADMKPIASDVRVGNKSTFDEALGLTNGNSMEPRKAKGKEVSAVKQVDELLKKHVGVVVRGIDAVAKINGGQGKWHTQANKALGELITALTEMRKGNQ